MAIENNAPGFVVVEQDPFISQDIEDIILSAFDTVPVVLEHEAMLAGALHEQKLPTVVIASTKSDNWGDAVEAATADKTKIALVLIGSLGPQAADQYCGATLVPSPFSSETLFDGIKTACASLRSHQS